MDCIIYFVTNKRAICYGGFLTKLYKKGAIAITSFFVENETINKKDRSIYEYGFEILFSGVIHFSFFLTIALLSQTFFPSLSFAISFFILRSIAGGYHSPTHLKCTILSTIVHLLFVMLYHLIPFQLKIILTSLVFFVSSIIIFMCAPIDHPNKRFIKSEKKRFRKMSCIYAVIILIVSILNLFQTNKMLILHMFGYMFGTFIAAISLSYEKNFKERK